MSTICKIPYSRKVWQGESLANLANLRRFAKLKPSKLIATIDNPLVDLFIRQTFFHQTLKNSRFAKHSAHQTFPLYSILTSYISACSFLEEAWRFGREDWSHEIKTACRLGKLKAFIYLTAKTKIPLTMLVQQLHISYGVLAVVFVGQTIKNFYVLPVRMGKHPWWNIFLKQ